MELGNVSVKTLKMFESGSNSIQVKKNISFEVLVCAIRVDHLMEFDSSYSIIIILN